MMIWIDITHLRTNAADPTGVPRVMRAMISAFQKKDSVGYCTFSPHRRRFIPYETPDDFTGPVNKRVTQKKKSHLWRQLLRLYHFTGFEHIRHFLSLPRPAIFFRANDVLLLPFMFAKNQQTYIRSLKKSASAPKIAAFIHDVIPVNPPTPLLPRFVAYYMSYIDCCLQHCSYLIVPSENTARDICEYQKKRGYTELPIFTVREPDVLDAASQMSERLKLLTDTPFVLSVANLADARKNLALLQQVWGRLIQGRTPEHVPILVLAGFLREKLSEQLAPNQGLSERVMVVRNATESELSWLYKNCQFTMMPSLYEGWGLPVAESLAAGKFCIASNASSLPEIGGDLIDYHNPKDVDECYRLVLECLENPEGLAEKEMRIRQEYKVTSVERFGEELYQILTSL